MLGTGCIYDFIKSSVKHTLLDFVCYPVVFLSNTIYRILSKEGSLLSELNFGTLKRRTFKLSKIYLDFNKTFSIPEMKSFSFFQRLNNFMFKCLKFSLVKLNYLVNRLIDNGVYICVYRMTTFIEISGAIENRFFIKFF